LATTSIVSCAVLNWRATPLVSVETAVYEMVNEVSIGLELMK
jgi:hypothetical protein